MKSWTMLLTVATVASTSLAGCEDKPEQVAPEIRGARNESCLAANYCDEGLSCVSGRCSPTAFSIETSGKQCILWQCDTDEDCCQGKPSDAPTKCADREEICAFAAIPGCATIACESDAECDGGTCGVGSCSESFDVCLGDADCSDVPGVCNALTGVCQDGVTDCVTSLDCPTEPDTCAFRSCDCSNPLFDPADPICTDPDCDDLCTEVCHENNLCGEDTSCEADDDCIGQAGSICDDEGRCVECESDDDCDEDNDEVCNDATGFCRTPCKFDQECAAFYECDDAIGECVEVGCRTRKDCVLYPGLNTLQDPRLAECVVADDGIGDCRLPCDDSSHCQLDELCSDGFCEEIGCETDAQCDRSESLQGQNVDEFRPYVTQGRCVDIAIE